MSRKKKEYDTNYKNADERKKALYDTIKEINKTTGESIIKLASEEKPKDRISFGVPELDNFTGGAICGNFTVIYGGKDVGKTSLAYHQITYAQKQNKICAWIDLEHSFSVERAKDFGIKLDDLILISGANSAEDAMDIIIKFANRKVVDLVIVDSIQAMSPEGEQRTKTGSEKSTKDDTMALLARKLGQFFRMCATPIYKANMAVVLIGQVRTKGIGSFYTYDGLSGGNALDHWMKLCLYMRIGQKTDAPTEKIVEVFTDPDGKEHKQSRKEIVGHDTVIKIEKAQISNCSPKGSEIHLPFYWKTGFIKIDDNVIIDETKFTEEAEKKKRGRPKKK